MRYTHKFHNSVETLHVTSLHGYKLEPGTVIIPSIYLVHHREDLYPEPKQFKPERFLERQYAPYEFLPFGGGNRRCIGMAFALFEMKIVIATVLLNWEISMTEIVKPIRKGLLLAPLKGVPMVVTGRRVKSHSTDIVEQSISGGKSALKVGN